MLYMVEMDLPDRSREAEWHRWYENHIRKLLGVEGFNSSQRFQSLTPTSSPFLAVHNDDGPEVFESASYRAVGGPSGTGEWRGLMTNWYRNLFDGLTELPEVEQNEKLVVIEDGSQPLPQRAADVTWLSVTGLDRSAGRRGILILKASEEPAAYDGLEGVRIFAPITAKLR